MHHTVVVSGWPFPNAAMGATCAETACFRGMCVFFEHTLHWVRGCTSVSILPTASAPTNAGSDVLQMAPAGPFCEDALNRVNE